jgi:hypothetical protein
MSKMSGERVANKQKVDAAIEVFRTWCCMMGIEVVSVARRRKGNPVGINLAEDWYKDGQNAVVFCNTRLDVHNNTFNKYINASLCGSGYVGSEPNIYRFMAIWAYG